MARHPVLTILMVIGGLILLLPGACAIFFITMGGPGGDSALVSLWFVCFLISAGGVVLIVKAFR
jgi:hypothetical protein